MSDSDPQDPKEGSGSTRFVAFGVAFGIIIGAVLFVVTQNPIWIGIGLVLGIVVGAALQAYRG